MNIRDVDCGCGIAFQWTWRWGFQPQDFDGGNTFWFGPFRVWAFW